MLMQHVKNGNTLHLFDNDTFFIEVPVQNTNDLVYSGSEVQGAYQADIEYAISYLQSKSRGSESDQAQIDALKDYLD